MISAWTQSGSRDAPDATHTYWVDPPLLKEPFGADPRKCLFFYFFIFLFSNNNNNNIYLVWPQRGT
jgi:hypothetical protein